MSKTNRGARVEAFKRLLLELPAFRECAPARRRAGTEVRSLQDILQILGEPTIAAAAAAMGPGGERRSKPEGPGLQEEP